MQVGKKISFQAGNMSYQQNKLISKNIEDNFKAEEINLELNLIAKRGRSINLMDSIKKLLKNVDRPISDFFVINIIVNKKR